MAVRFWVQLTGRTSFVFFLLTKILRHFKPSVFCFPFPIPVTGDVDEDYIQSLFDNVLDFGKGVIPDCVVFVLNSVLDQTLMDLIDDIAVVLENVALTGHGHHVVLGRVDLL